MARETSLYRMADKLLDGRLRQIVLEARELETPWVDIAASLRQQDIPVSGETLRSWFREYETPETNGDRVGAA